MRVVFSRGATMSEKLGSILTEFGRRASIGENSG